MSAIRPRMTPQHPNNQVMFMVIGIVLVGLLAASILWLAGHIATKAETGAWAKTDWSPFLLWQVPSEGLDEVFPKAHTGFFFANVAIFALVVIAALTWIVWKVMTRPAPDAAERSLAKSKDVHQLSTGRVKAQAVSLRKSLKGRKPRSLKDGEAGLVLGNLDLGGGKTGPQLMAGLESSVCAIMAPRSGKTSSLITPNWKVDGPLLVTSNKSDVLVTAGVRGNWTGEAVNVFDPQQIARSKQTWWWNPLAEVNSVESAERLAGHFIAATMSADKGTIWPSAAIELLGGLILAAALDDQPISKVYSWLQSERPAAAADILDEHGYMAVGESLKSVEQQAPETRASVFFTARAATASLRDRDILAWITPPADDLPQFDPAKFVNSRQTLYALSKDKGGSAAALVAALTDSVIRAGIRRAEALGGRIDPPLFCLIDEASSAPIGDLHLLISHTGGRGVIVMVVLQSWPQGASVWKEEGMASLWGACTVKLVGAGQEDRNFNDLLSKLVGTHWVTTASYSVGGHKGGGQVSSAVTKADILSPAQIRAIPQGKALMFASGSKPAMVQMKPWWETDDRKNIEIGSEVLAKKIAARAQT